MKIIVAFMVLMSVAAASANVKENVSPGNYNPTQLEGTKTAVKPIKPKPIR